MPGSSASRLLIVVRTAALLGVAFLISGCQVLLQKASEHRNALWIITHDMCVTNYARNQLPSPCAQVNMDVGYVLLKDRRGRSQYLLIPTDRVTGMEDPAILAAQSPNYLYYAWLNRYRVGAALHRTLPASALSLAINPANARSQDQLHIHIDCIRPDVRADLDRNAARIGETWSDWEWQGDQYHVRRLRAAEFQKLNPFSLVADGIPGARADMGHQTIFMTAVAADDATNGANGDSDLLLVVRHLGLPGLDGQGAEVLQDHRCAIAP